LSNRDKIKIIKLKGRSSCSLGFEVIVIISLYEILGVFLEGRNLRCFSLGYLVEFANVFSIEFVFLLSVSELNEGFAHFCFF